MLNSRNPDVEFFVRCAPLHAYVSRVAHERGLDFDVKNFRKIVLSERGAGGRYRRDRIEIKIAADGTVTTRPEGFGPTEEEAAAIKAALATVTVPKWTPGSKASSNTLRIKLGVAREDWFEILDASRTKVVMCQQRVKTEGGKAYLPRSFWNDME